MLKKAFLVEFWEFTSKVICWVRHVLALSLPSKRAGAERGGVEETLK